MKRILFLSFFSCLSFMLYAQHEGHDHGTPAKVADTRVQPAAAVKAAPAAETIGNPASDPKIIPAPEVKKGEETLILKEDVYDFGKIPQGKPVTHVFDVTNSGKTDLKIANVQASCGCTTPEWEKDKAIPAGGNSKITVGYNAAAEGPFSKLVTITYNENFTKLITIKGEVWKTPSSSAPVNSALNDLKN